MVNGDSRGKSPTVHVPVCFCGSALRPFPLRLRLIPAQSLSFTLAVARARCAFESNAQRIVRARFRRLLAFAFDIYVTGNLVGDLCGQ